ncbi:homeotic protein female sterile [Trichonephila clavipes]|nr:homeotic protein female sterile [Trichonephila clavipes]
MDSTGLDILSKLSRLGQRKQVCLQWIPSHVGVPGNEAADELAGIGCDLSNPSSTVSSHSEIPSFQRTKMNLTWQNRPAHHWNASMNPGLSLQCRSSRAHQTTLARFRSGHLHSMTIVQGVKSFFTCPCSLPTSPARLLTAGAFPCDSCMKSKTWCVTLLRGKVNKTTPEVNSKSYKIVRRNHVIFCRVQQLQEFHKSNEHIQEPLKFVFNSPLNKDYDEELTKNIHSTIVEDRKAREENLRIEEQKEKLRIEEREEKLRFEQLKLDEQKRKYEFELEKLRIQIQSKLGADTSKESDSKFLVKEISKLIHRFDLKEDISLYLKLFERQAQRLNIDQEKWVSHLLGLLPTEVSHIIAREPDDKANSYEHVKHLLLKRFKLTPEKFRQLFVTHQKAPENTWIDFYHELNTYFNGWIDGLKIDTFNKLSDLIITDQLKRKTPFEFK